MYGAILGDIIGYNKEITISGKFYLTDNMSYRFTDYTVVSIAVADSLLSLADYAGEDEVKEAIKTKLNYWYNSCFGMNYASIFISNAAATISVIPYIYDNPDIIINTAKIAASVINNDKLSIDDAAMAAYAIYCAGTLSRDIIQNSIESKFNFRFSEFDDLNDDIVLESIVDFLESVDLYDAIDKSFARGGDMRTRAVITGSIAGAFYGISDSAKYKCNRVLTEEMFKILDEFDSAFRRFSASTYEREKRSLDDNGFGNQRIEKAIERYNEQRNGENKNNSFYKLIETIYLRMHEGAEMFIPFNESAVDGSNYSKIKLKDGEEFIIAYTQPFPLEDFYSEYNIYLTNIKSLFETCLDEEAGLIINPNLDRKGAFALDKEWIESLLQMPIPKNRMFFYKGDVRELSVESIIVTDYINIPPAVFEDKDLLKSAHYMRKLKDSDIYAINTPLMNYEGEDADIIQSCCHYCLDLAKKYNLHSMAFPAEFITTEGRSNSLVESVGFWFKDNNNYGMDFIVPNIISNKTDDKGKFIKINFDKVFEHLEKKNNELNNENKIPPIIDNKVKPTSEEAKQKVREYASRFATKEDFYKELKKIGLKWRGENSKNEKIVDMWARHALARAIDEGYDPFQFSNFDETTQNVKHDEHDETLGNEQIEKAIEMYYAKPSEENIFNILKAIQQHMYEAGKFLTLMEPEIEYPCHDLEYKIIEEKRQRFIAAFTSFDESFDKEKQKNAFTCETKIKEIILLIADDEIGLDGVIINHYGKEFLITKKLAKKNT